jgi:hypothetical protein
MRAITELVDVANPSWPLLIGDLASSFTGCVVLPPDPDRCRATLLQLQVTARSPLGAITLNTGGILVHDGWLRVYGGSGGGPAGLPSMAEVNGFPDPVEPGWSPSAGLIVAHDVLGGVFALNGMAPEQHGRPGVPGGVVYFSPLTLTWQEMEMGHGQWLTWLLDGGAAGHYHDVLWPTWRTEVAELGLRDGITVYPFLWSQEAQQDMAATTRKPAPLDQILSMHAVSGDQLGLAQPGELGTCFHTDFTAPTGHDVQSPPRSERLATFHDKSGKVTVGVFRHDARMARTSHTDLAATVDDDMVVVGGGGISWNPADPATPNGTLLTASYPSAALDAWLVSSKDHHYREPHVAAAYAIGLAIEGMSREDLRDAIHLSIEQTHGQHPEATATLPTGFVLVGGGAKIDSPAGQGNLLTASFPANERSWTAKAKDHHYESIARLSVLALGLREELPIGRVEVSTSSRDSEVANHPAVAAVVNEGYAMIGGGAQVHWHGDGSLLWRLEPRTSAAGQEYVAGAKDHQSPDPSALTAYALGLRITGTEVDP